MIDLTYLSSSKEVIIWGERHKRDKVAGILHFKIFAEILKVLLVGVVVFTNKFMEDCNIHVK